MTNTTRRIYSVALIAALSLGLSGCWFNNNDEEPVPSVSSSASPTASASASAAPTASATVAPEKVKEIQKSQEDKPLGIDIKNALLTRSGPGLTEVFPAENFNMEEGVRQVLNTYQDLTSISEFQKARPEGSPADSQYLIGFEDGLHGDFLEIAKKKLDEGGQLFPTADRDGSLGELDGVKYHATGNLISNYGEPAFGVVPHEEFGNLLVITGLRADRVSTVEGKDLGLEYTYTIWATPSAGKWLITGMAIKNTSAKVLNG
jgi:hypothetical protein